MTIQPAPYVPGCPHHDYFRFMTSVDPFDRTEGKRAACIACDEHRTDEWCRHRLDEAYARGTAVPDGIIR